MTVVTRFAPSPTGDLHIGGARTALFNMLYARHMGGKYVVRIEDTDKARNTKEAMDGIHGALDWLELAGDETIVYQSERAGRHVEVANELLRRGAAYCDFTTEAEMDALKEAHNASGAKGPFRYKSPWRDGSEVNVSGQPFVIRLKAPREGAITIQDLVQGEVTVQCKELDDTILLRSDGTPTYMLAVVVDDHDMGVTHVIRGDDHLNNAFRQIPIYDGMRWDRPTYAHVPLILDETGKKLSKRHGAAGVFQYKALGIQPQAMNNYLARLGWGHGDDEIFSMAEASEWFDIKDVGRAPSRIDMKKLRNISQHYIKETNPADLLTDMLLRLDADGIKFDENAPKNLYKLIPSLQPRSANLVELYDSASFVWNWPVVLDEKTQAKLNPTIIREMRELLWEAGYDSNLSELLREYAEKSGHKLGDVAMSLRVALTGRTVSPPIDAVMYALGMLETLARLKDRF